MVDRDRDGPLVSMDVKDFILTVGARSPTPGGGSVAAVTAALVTDIVQAFQHNFACNFCARR
jgi:formiminotetrahydrofolate cyclodeaminase